MFEKGGGGRRRGKGGERGGEVGGRALSIVVGVLLNGKLIGLIVVA